MKFKFRKHELGEDFLIDKFAWFPICINGECRWLQRVKIEAHYYKGALGVDISYHCFID
jgi:hypothetical protein